MFPKGKPPFDLKDLPPGLPDFRFLYFSELLKRLVCAGKIGNRIGKLTDIVFALKEHYPEPVGLYLEHGWGKPTEFIPWGNVIKIEDDAIFVKPPEDGNTYPPFKDQPGWLLVDSHLIGRTILDMDGRRLEVVNDVHLLASKGRMLLVHVDTSLNGILRRWGLGGLKLIKENLISWKFVQPLSLEDAAITDKVSLSVTKKQLQDLPSEDLADALEELSGKEQQALFSALDSEKAAETLLEAEPRAQRKLIANLRKERARTLFSEMTVAQLAALFSILPHHDATALLELLPPESAQRVRGILSERESAAQALMSRKYMTAPATATVGQILSTVRSSGLEHNAVSYVYVVREDGRTLTGVVDLRDLVLASDTTPLSSMMVEPVVSAKADDLQEDLAEIFAKYHYRMIPVVDTQDRIMGVIHYNDIMKGQATRI
jgi:magnesium transporter